MATPANVPTVRAVALRTTGPRSGRRMNATLIGNQYPLGPSITCAMIVADMIAH